MINFKREYIGLEQDRLLYPVSFKDKAKCNVYGRKKFITEAGEVQLSAHVFLISKDFWTFNAGQLDFTNYPNGIWNDYISIDIIEKDEYTAPSINFGSMGDITPENLQGLSDYISKHLSDLEKRIVEDYLFIDEGVSENIELPNLPENHFWVRKNGVIVGVNLDYLKADYEHLKNELWKNYESFNEKLQAALKKYYDDLELQMNNFFKDLMEKIREEAEKQLGLIAGAGGGLLHKIDQANHGFIFDPIVYENGVWKKATTTSGVDGIGVVISANTFFFLEAGEIEIPKGATDKDGQPLLDDEYYYMNEDGGTGFQKEEPVWFYQPLFHTRTYKGKLLANVHIDTMEDLRGQVVDTESGRTHGIALWGDIVPKFDTIEKLQKAFWLKEGEVVEVLGYYSAGDGAGHKRIIANEDDGSGVKLNNSLWANIVHNGEVNVSWFGIEAEKMYDWYDNVDFNRARKNWEKLNKIANILKRPYMSKAITKVIIPRGDIIIDKTLHFINPSVSGSAFAIEGMGGGHSAFGLNGSTIVCVRRENFDTEPIGIVFSGMNNATLKDFCVTSKSSQKGKFNGVKITCVSERDSIGKYAQLNRYDNVSFINSCKLYNNDYTSELDYATLNNKLGQIGFYSNKQEDTTFINCMFDGGEKGTGLVGTIGNYCNIKTSETFDEDVYTGYSSANNIFLKCYFYGGITTVALDGCWNWNFKGYFNPYNVPTSNVLKLIGKGSHTIKIDEMQMEQSYTILGINNTNVSNFLTYNIVFANGTFSVPNNADIVKIYKNSESSLIRDIDLSTCDYGGKFNSFLKDERVEKNYIHNLKFKFEEGSSINYVVNAPNSSVYGVQLSSYTGFQMNNFKEKMNCVAYSNLKIIMPQRTIEETTAINQNANGKWNTTSSGNILAKNENGITVYDNGTSDKGYQIFVYVSEVGYLLLCSLYVYIPESNTDRKLSLTFNDLAFENETNFRWLDAIRFSNGDCRPISISNNEINIDLINSAGWANARFAINGYIRNSVVISENKINFKGNDNIIQKQIHKIDTSSYYTKKIKEEGVYNDFITYMDEKTAYDKQQRKLEQDRQLAYEEALKENPELTHEEFMSLQPMTLNLIEEPQLSEALKKFMEKYL